MARYADCYVDGQRYRVELPGQASSAKEHRKMIAAAMKKAEAMAKKAKKPAKKGKAKK